MDSRCDSSYFFFFKGRGKFLIIFLTKMFNRRTNVALAGNASVLGEEADKQDHIPDASKKVHK